MPLDYTIAEKSEALVISFTGEMTRDHLEVIEKCRSEASAKNFAFVVLNFSGIKRIDRHAVKPLALIQQTLRQKPAELRLCGLELKLREFLREQGCIREAEIMNNLTDAIRSMKIKVSNINRQEHAKNSEKSDNNEKE